MIKFVSKSFLIFIVFTILIFSCAPNKVYNLKKFFFDGVPAPIVANVEAKDTISLGLLDSLERSKIIINKPEFVIHKPYLEKKCNDCHYAGSMGKLKTPLKDLCYTCHTNFNTAYSSLHGPVASGNCTQCHNPHRSKLNSLLLEEGNQLCFKCHDKLDIDSSKIHKTIGDKSCVTCHNPHGGANKGLLQDNACYECHEKFEATYTYMHGPVGAGGLCVACHESHDSTKPSLLKLTANELCLNCHNKADIYRTQTHLTSKKQSCTHCHNPHGSNQPMLLAKKSSE